MRLSQNRFGKKFLGNSFFGDAVDIDIHEELKNELTTKFEAKDRFCDSLLISTGRFLGHIFYDPTSSMNDDQIFEKGVYLNEEILQKGFGEMMHYKQRFLENNHTRVVMNCINCR